MRSTGRSTISSLNTAKDIGTVPTDTEWVVVQPLTQNVRVTFDGTTTPTASVGIRLVAGTLYKIKGILLSKLKFIEETASATLEVVFFHGDGELTTVK